LNDFSITFCQIGAAFILGTLKGLLNDLKE